MAHRFERVLEGVQGIVVSTTGVGIETFDELGRVCANYGQRKLMSGFVLNATVARNAGGIDRAASQVVDPAHGSNLAIYDRAGDIEPALELQENFAHRMRDSGIGSVILHPAADGLAESLIPPLHDYDIGMIVDIGIESDADSFDVGEVWSTVVGKAVRRGIRAFAVPGDAPASVGALNSRLLSELGEGHFALMAAYTSAGALMRALDATDGILHTVVPAEMPWLTPVDSPDGKLQYSNAKDVFDDYIFARFGGS